MKLLPFALHLVADIAVAAGKEILEVYRDEKLFGDVTYKSDDSPLTLADERSNQVILEGLKRLDPGIPVISEESADIPYEVRKRWDRFWLVDPLDGTKEFLKRNDQFTVNIALIENGRPVMGVIVIPAIDTTYSAYEPLGAFKTSGGFSTRIQSNQQTTSLISVGSSSHASPEEEYAQLQSFDIVKHIPVGSSIKFCMIAEGTADIYYRNGPTMEWDTAAGHAIVAIAGGGVHYFGQQSSPYNKPHLLNPPFLCMGNPELLAKNISAQ